MKPILVHVHVFYAELWDELAKCVQNIKPFPFVLYVTMVKADDTLKAKILEAFPSAHIEVVENRGFDVAPFLHVINNLDLDEFSYIVKLHTKRDIPFEKGSFKGLVGDIWRKKLLYFVSSEDIFKKYIQEFDRNSKVGMQAQYELIVRRDFYDMYSSKQTKKFIVNHGLPMVKYRFVAGTMFVVRAHLFKEIQRLGIKSADFPEVIGRPKQPQLAHIFERLFGYFVYAQGFELKDGAVSWEIQRNHLNWFEFFYLLRPVVRAFFQKKITKSGELCIKICKIPLPVGWIKHKN